MWNCKLQQTSILISVKFPNPKTLESVNCFLLVSSWNIRRFRRVPIVRNCGNNPPTFVIKSFNQKRGTNKKINLRCVIDRSRKFSDGLSLSLLQSRLARFEWNRTGTFTQCGEENFDNFWHAAPACCLCNLFRFFVFGAKAFCERTLFLGVRLNLDCFQPECDYNRFLHFSFSQNVKSRADKCVFRLMAKKRNFMHSPM